MKTTTTILICSALTLFAVGHSAEASVWINPDWGNWSDEANWSDDVPNGPGDTATFGDAFPTDMCAIAIEGDIHLGTIESLNENDVNLYGSGSIVMDSGGDGTAELRLGEGAALLRIFNQLSLAPGDDLLAEVATGAELNFAGVFVGGNATVTKTGEGRLVFAKANPAWTGVLDVLGGTVEVTDAKALGTAAGHTRLAAGGTLAIGANGSPNAEPIVLDGGSLTTTAEGAYVLVGPVEMRSTGVLRSASGGLLQLQGPMHGSGEAIVDAGRVELSGDNTFTGDVRITGGELIVRQQQAFGGPGSRIIAETGGKLQLGFADVSDARIALDGGRLEAAPVTTTTMAGTLELLSDGVVTAGHSSRTLELNGPITGPGGVTFETGTIQVRGENTYAGPTIVDSGLLRIYSDTGLGAGTGTDADGTTVNSNGELWLLENVGNEKIRLDGGIVGVYRSLEGPLEFVSDSKLRTLSGSRVSLHSPISGPGKVNIIGNSMSLYGDNTHTGETVMEAYDVRAESPTALGSPEAGTTVLRGTLSLNGPTEEPLRIVEEGVAWISQAPAPYIGPITLVNGGELEVNPDVSVESPITIESGEGFIRGHRWGCRMSGGVTGKGNLRIAGITVEGRPLAHDGDLIAEGGWQAGVILNTPNTYTGDTILREGGGIAVNHVDALGTSTNPILCEGGLGVNVPLSRDIELAGGRVDFNGSSRYDGTISALGGDIRGAGSIHGTILMQDQPENRLAWRPLYLRGESFDGTISGEGILNLIGPETGLDMNSANTHTGLTKSGGIVNVNHPNALGSNEVGTYVNAGTLNINVVTDEPLFVSRGKIALNVQLSRLPTLVKGDVGGEFSVNVPSVYDESVRLIDSAMTVNEDTTVRSVVLGGEEGGTIRVAEGKSLTVSSGELVISSGEIFGRIEGVQQIRKISPAQVQLDELTGFTGDVLIEQGQLLIEENSEFSNSPGAIRVTGSQDAMLELRAGVELNKDVFLNNTTAVGIRGLHAWGYDYAGLDGRLDLGSIGSVLGGRLELRGPVTGGSLTLVGGSRGISLTSTENTYHGVTDIRDGGVSLHSAGRITNSSEIIIHEDASLQLANHVGEYVADRVEDSIPIALRGGTLKVNSPLEVPGIPIVESFGEVRIQQGQSVISNDASAPTSSYHGMTLASLVRSPGATVRFDFSYVRDANCRIMIDNPPALNDGLIGGWATTAGQFATYGPEGIAPVEVDKTSFVGAGPHDNVRLDNVEQLTTDTTINSLNAMGAAPSFDPVDLGGHLLTIESGGILAPRNGFANGRITVGPEANGELIFYNYHDMDMSADIVDNGTSPLSVVFSAAGFSGSNVAVHLAGNNTYSGSTTVVDGVVHLDSETALPEGGDVILHGGGLAVRNEFTQPKQMGKLVIRDGGSLGGKQWSGPDFDFSTIELQDGGLGWVHLLGDAPITKTTMGTVRFAGAENPDFHGSILIQEGIFEYDGLDGSLGTGVVTIEGGMLRLVGDSNHGNSRDFTSDTVLAGGEISLNYGSSFTGSIKVIKPSCIRLDQSENYFYPGHITGAIRGSQPLTTDGGLGRIHLSGDNSEFSGGMSVVGGTLSGNHGAFGTGPITIHEEGCLELYDKDGVAAPIVLAGGSITAADASRIDGPVSVVKDSRIDANDDSDEESLLISGDVSLADGVQLTKADPYDVFGASYDAIVAFNGRLNVGRDTALIAYNGGIEILGTIASAGPESSIDFVGQGMGDWVFDESIDVAAGHSLTVLRDGLPATLEIDSPGKTVSGGGTLRNDLTIGGEATLQPGNSAGTLTVDGNLILDGDSVYVWEIRDAAGIGGTSDDWDLVDVTGTLSFDAGEDNPITLRLLSLDANDNPGTCDGFNPGQSYRWTIASADEILAFDPSGVTIDTSGFELFNPTSPLGDFSLQQHSGNLTLAYTVPEPGTWALLLTGVVALFGLGLTRRGRRVGGRMLIS